eukprot:1614637-Karenia_brevis.AAC.1
MSLVGSRPDGTPDLTGKVGKMILLSERVVLIHIKDRKLKAKLPDIDKVELFTIQMGHTTYDQKVAYLKKQMKESSIKADQFRAYWKNH